MTEVTLAQATTNTRAWRAAARAQHELTAARAMLAELGIDAGDRPLADVLREVLHAKNAEIEQMTRLAKLAAMRDEDIDTSDIPVCEDFSKAVRHNPKANDNEGPEEVTAVTTVSLSDLAAALNVDEDTLLQRMAGVLYKREEGSGDEPEFGSSESSLWNL